MSNIDFTQIVTAEAKESAETSAKRSELLSATRQHYRQAMSLISSAYPLEEREGWPEQIEAAKEVIAGGQNQLIETLAQPRGKTPLEMAQTVLAKRAQYQTVYGAMTARLHALEAEIKGAPDLASLSLIDPTIGWDAQFS